MKSFFPLLSQLENYTREDLSSDLAAGFTVAVMLIPQGMAYALIAVVVSTLLVWALDLHEHGVELVGAVPSGLPGATMGPFDPHRLFARGGMLTWTQVQSLLTSAVAIALIAFVSTVTAAKIYASKRGYEIDPSQELVGLGLANIVGAVFQAYPVTGSLSRTAVNEWQVSEKEFGVLLLTALITLFIGIKEGILAGILISLLLFVRRSFRPNITTVGRLPETNTFADIERHEEACTRSDVIVFRIDSSLHFANAKYLTNQMLDVMAEDEALTALILDAYPVNRMDGTAAYMLRDVIEKFHAQDYEFYFAGVKGELMDRLRRAGVVERVGEDHFFRNVHRAVDSVTDSIESPAHASPIETESTRAGEREDKEAPAGRSER